MNALLRRIWVNQVNRVPKENAANRWQETIRSAFIIKNISKNMKSQLVFGAIYMSHIYRFQYCPIIPKIILGFYVNLNIISVFLSKLFIYGLYNKIPQQTLTMKCRWRSVYNIMKDPFEVISRNFVLRVYLVDRHISASSRNFAQSLE